MTSRDEHQQNRDEQALDPETITDLEVPAPQADDVRGGKCQGNVKPEATLLPSGTCN